MGPTSTPQNQRKQREKPKEAHNKSKEVTPTSETMLGAIIIKKAFFFNGTKLILPRSPPLAVGPTAVVVLTAGSREAGGGGLARVRPKRRVGVRVRRGAHRAEDWAGVEGVGGLFAIVRVAGWALDIVGRPAG